MPNFLIIGAAKSGTTSLYHYLRQHPQIFMPQNKEPKFFAFEGEPETALLYTTANTAGASGHRRGRYPAVTDIDEYRNLFAPATIEVALGEASVGYLVHPRAPERILHHIPDARLIAILRHPAERAFSHYGHRLVDGRESASDFSLALERPDEQVGDRWAPVISYREQGFYYRNLSRYRRWFDLNRIMVILYEDFETAPASVFRRIFEFLEVDDDFLPDTSVRHNVTPAYKSRVVGSLIARPSLLDPVKRLIPSALRQRIVKGALPLDRRPAMDAELRARLIEEYRDDIIQLQGLIGRDLAAWLR